MNPSRKPLGARLRARLAGLVPLLAPFAAAAQPLAGWQAGAVLDASIASRAIALGQRDKGAGLGHSDLSAGGPLGSLFQAQLTGAVHTHDQKAEFELEEAWVQTLALPAGWQLRAGRFASQLGYLNEQHPHADDFVERPLLHRAFLGGHWSDDGLRLNWTAPTATYLRLGAEVFRGHALVKEAVATQRPGAFVLSMRAGGDVGTSHAWQAGLSWLHNRRKSAVEEHEEEEHEEHTGHAHGATYSGRRMWLADLAWKWAPDGNNGREQVRVALEHAQVQGRHRASTLSMVWRFAPTWEVGARADVLRTRTPHEGHVDEGSLREAALMLAWKPTHAQTLRLQLTRQRGGGSFETVSHAVQLQYILGFGRHAAHAF